MEMLKPRPIAYAYAKREIDETRSLELFLSEYTGSEPRPLTDEEMDLRVERGALRVEAILNLPPASPLNRRVERMFLHAHTMRAFRTELMPLAETNKTEHLLNTAVRPLADAYMKILVFDRELDGSVNAIRILCTAAQQNGEYTPQAMFIDDNLFATMVGDNVRPDDFLRSKKQGIENFTARNLAAIYGPNLLGVLSLVSPDVVDIEKLIPGVIRGFAKGLLGQIVMHEANQFLESFAQATRWGYRAFYLERARRYWGSSLEGLPTQSLRELAIG